MPISISGDGTITGVAVGGLPDGCVDQDMIASSVRVGLVSQQVFTSSGTWNKPTGIKTVKVYVTGGGGAGSGVGGNRLDDSGQGGAAGGTSIKIIDVSSISAVTVTIGAGGTASNTEGTDGGDGGTTSFGSYASATGGQGGRSGTNNVAQCAAGVGSNGDINLYGGHPNTSGSNLNPYNNTTNHVSLLGFGGGHSFWGGPNLSAWWTTGGFGQTTKTGISNGAPGTGGSGGSGDANPGASNGGNCSGGGMHGKAGIVVVEEYK